MHFTTAVAISAALVFGAALGLVGELKQTVASRLDLARPRLRLLTALLNGVFIPAVLLAGLLVDHWGVRGTVIVGSATLALAVLALGDRPAYSRAVLALTGADLGAAGVLVGAVVLMPHAFFRPGQELSALLLGHAFIALGALLSPPLTGVLLPSLGLRRTVVLLALLFLAPAFLAALPAAKGLAAANPSAREVAGHLEDPALVLLALLVLTYAPLEAGLSAWVVRYRPDTARADSSAEGRGGGGLLFGFWAGFVLSRLLAAWLLQAGVLDPAWDGWGLFLLALFVLVALGNLASTSYPGSTALGILAVGLLLGPLFPILVGLAFRRFEDERGTTFGLLVAVGSLGSWLLARFVPADPNVRHQAGPAVPIALALALTVLGLVHLLLT